jgi:hypothetical protein
MSRRPLTLTDDERYLLNHYTTIYKEQLKSIDLMYNELKETRDIIDFITRVDERFRRTIPINNSVTDSTNANTNANTNASTSTNTSRPSAVYRWDYYIPIDDLEDVIISPTQEEITSNTRNIIFNTITSPLNMSCPITLERFEDNTECTQIIGCGHLFNRDGLTQWLRGNVRCPICRYDIRNRNAPMTDASFNVLSEQLLTSLFSSRRRSRRMDISS